MKTFAALTVVFILLIASSATFAKDRLANQPDQTRKIQQTIFMEQAHATLKRSSYYLDIQKVDDRVEVAELELLAQLQVTTDDKKVARILVNLERLEVERELGILRVQARYAHSAGMLDLEMKIRERILNLLEEDFQR